MDLQGKSLRTLGPCHWNGFVQAGAIMITSASPRLVFLNNLEIGEPLSARNRAKGQWIKQAYTKASGTWRKIQGSK